MADQREDSLAGGTVQLMQPLATLRNLVRKLQHSRSRTELRSRSRAVNPRSVPPARNVQAVPERASSSSGTRLTADLTSAAVSTASVERREREMADREAKVTRRERELHAQLEALSQAPETPRLIQSAGTSSSASASSRHAAEQSGSTAPAAMSQSAPDPTPRAERNRVLYKHSTEAELRLNSTVLYAPGMDAVAKDLQVRLCVPEALCTKDMMLDTKNFGPNELRTADICWDRFQSADPNIKLRVKAVKDKHVIFIMNMEQNDALFEQLAVLLFLQRFTLPNPEQKYADGKWKATIREDAYTTCAVASITIVCPWCRYGQMERTSRWTIEDGKWFNGKADGEFVDAPTLLSFAELLASAPCDGAHPVPRRLLFIDVHEYEALETTLNATGQFANRPREYDLSRGVGTYLASAFALYLRETLVPLRHLQLDKTYVVFPDQGAHRRYYTMVQAGGRQDAGDVELLPFDHILFLHKERVGETTDVVEKLFYVDADKVEHEKVEQIAFPAEAYVLIADDFTNSGGTLFKGAKVIRDRAGPRITVEAFVTHFVAQYDRDTVSAFVNQLYGGEGQPPIDKFACTNSIPGVVEWLRAEVGKRDASASRIHVTSLAPIISEWVTEEEELLALTEVARKADIEGKKAVNELRDRNEAPGDLWQSEIWLKSIVKEKGLLEPLIKALLKPLHALKGGPAGVELLGAEDTVYRSAAELYFLQHLSDHDVRELLSHKSVPGDFSIKVNKERKDLIEENSNGSPNLKFDFNLKFGDMSYFYTGLESLIGAPRANILQTMEREHCEGKEATQIFVIENCVLPPPRLLDHNKMPTVPKLEWLLLTDHKEGKRWLWEDDVADELRKLLLSPQFNLISGSDPGSAVGSARRLRTRHELEQVMKKKNEELNKLKVGEEMLLLKEEMLAACLYTGPMYMKYNSILRELLDGIKKEPSGAQSNATAQSEAAQNTVTVRGRYTTTMHAINSSILKLSKLTVATTVYRGITGGRLPVDFGKLGGVEIGFMSTTEDRQVALHYAGAEKRSKIAIVMEMKQGLANARGANLADLSQYPGEAEILWPPLTAIEVEETVIQKRVLVVRARPTCNTNSLTITEVINKRRKMVHEMLENMELEIQRDLDVALHDNKLALFTNQSTPGGGKWLEEVVKLKKHVANLGITAFKDLYETCCDYEGSEGITLTKQVPEYFNEADGLGDRRFGTALEHALRMKLAAVEHVSELFDRSVYSRCSDHMTTGNARLSLAGLSLRTVLATRKGSNSFPIRACVFMHGLKEFTMVKSIDLGNTMLETQSAKIVFEALSVRDKSNNPIVALDLVDNPDLDHKSANAFTTLTHVKTFFRHRMASTEFEKFGEVHHVLLEKELQLNLDLTSLTVCKSGKAPGAARKGEGFEHGENLPLGRIVGAALARSLCLKRIDLRLCSLGSSGLEALIGTSSQSNLRWVEHLNVGYNNIGPKGAGALAAVLGHADAADFDMMTLSVAGNFVLDDGASELQGFFGNARLCPHFKNLDLRLNGLSSDKCIELKKTIASARPNVVVQLENNVDDTLASDARKAKYDKDNNPPAQSLAASRPTAPCPGGAAASDSADEASMPPLIVCGALNMDLLTNDVHLFEQAEANHGDISTRLKKSTKGDTFSTSAGGKGLNQSMAASHLLKKIIEMCQSSNLLLPAVHLIGAVGKDSNGVALQTELKKAGVETDLLYVDSEKPTGVANIIMIKKVPVDGANKRPGQEHVRDACERVMVHVDGANERLGQAHVRDAFEYLIAKHGIGGLRGGVLCLQCEVEMQTNLAALERAHSLGLTTVMRAGGGKMEKLHRQNPEYLSLIDVLVVQDDEVQALINVLVVPDDELNAVRGAVDLKVNKDGDFSIVGRREEDRKNLEKNRKNRNELTKNMDAFVKEGYGVVTSEVVCTQDSATSEVARTHGCDTSEVARTHSRDTSEAAVYVTRHDGDTSEVDRTHGGDTSEVARTHGGDTSEKAETAREKWRNELVNLAIAGSVIAHLGVQYTIFLLVSPGYGGFGGCVLVSRRKLPPLHMPSSWAKLGWRCNLYPTPDGDDRMLVLETKPLVDLVDATGAADAFIGPLAVQLTSSLRDQFGFSNQFVRRLPLACALASLSLRYKGASSAYAATYQSAAAGQRKGNAGTPDLPGLDIEMLIEQYVTQYGERAKR